MPKPSAGPPRDDRGGSYVAVFITGIAIFAMFVFLTCILITSNLSSIVGLARLGPRILIATGMLLGAGGMAYLTQVSVTSSYASGVLPALLGGTPDGREPK